MLHGGQTERQYSPEAASRQRAGCGGRARARVERLVLISLDGLASADLPLLRSLPHFSRLIRAGSLCPELRGVYPTETYPLHASAVTGTWPDRHGVQANVRLQPGRVAADWHWYRRDLKAVPVYEVARKAGFRVATLLWPTAGRSGVRYCLPEIRPVRPGQSLVRMALGAGTPLFTLGLMLKNLYLLKDLSYSGLDELTTTAACRLLERGKADLILIHLLDLDGVRHRHGFRGPRVEEALRGMDRHLGALLQAGGGLDGSTAFVLFGDHAYIDVHTPLAVNEIFREAGLIRVETLRGPRQGTRRAPRVAHWRAWAVACGGSAQVYLREPSDAALRQRVRSLLRKLAGGLDGPVERVYEQDEVQGQRVGHDIDFMLEARPGFYFVPGLEVAPSAAGQAATHGYHPGRPGYSSLLIAAGAGVRRWQELPVARIVDIAPTVAALLGLPLPEAEGQVLTAMLEEGESP